MLGPKSGTALAGPAAPATTALFSREIQQIKMAKMAVAKDSDRGLTWTHDETRALIRLWADSEIQKDRFETC